MSYSLTITDKLSPHLAQVTEGLGGDRLKPLIGRSAVNTFRANFDHLEASRPNTLGAPRQHFWSQCRRSTHHSVLADRVRISVSQVGARQRLEGGTITATNASFLTIPARAEYYGHRATEFNNLRFAVLGAAGPALIVAEAAEIVRWTKKGYVHKEQEANEVAYWLRKSVTQRPDPTVIPSSQAILANIVADTRSYLERLGRRA